MNGLENFTFEEWICFILLCAAVLFFIYPRGNGEFDHDYYSDKEDDLWLTPDQGKKKSRTRYWWEDEEDYDGKR